MDFMQVLINMTVKKPKILKEIDWPEGRGYLVRAEKTQKEAEATVKYIHKWYTSSKTKVVPVKISEKETVYAVYRVS
jgi:hypothetical protein